MAAAASQFQLKTNATLSALSSSITSNPEYLEEATKASVEILNQNKISTEGMETIAIRATMIAFTQLETSRPIFQMLRNSVVSSAKYFNVNEDKAHAAAQEMEKSTKQHLQKMQEKIAEITKNSSAILIEQLRPEEINNIFISTILSRYSSVFSKLPEITQAIQENIMRHILLDSLAPK